MKLPGKGKIPNVMGGHGHDGPGSVRGDHIIRNPNRQRRLRHRMDGIRPRKDPGLFSNLRDAGSFTANGNLLDIGLDGRPSIRNRDFFNQGVFRSKDHVSSSEQGIWAGGEHLDSFVGPTSHLEKNPRSFRSTDPIPLHLFDGVRPID